MIKKEGVVEVGDEDKDKLIHRTFIMAEDELTAVADTKKGIEPNGIIKAEPKSGSKGVMND